MDPARLAAAAVAEVAAEAEDRLRWCAGALVLRAELDRPWPQSRLNQA